MCSLRRVLLSVLPQQAPCFLAACWLLKLPVLLPARCATERASSSLVRQAASMAGSSVMLVDFVIALEERVFHWQRIPSRLVEPLDLSQVVQAACRLADTYGRLKKSRWQCCSALTNHAHSPGLLTVPHVAGCTTRWATASGNRDHANCGLAMFLTTQPCTLPLALSCSTKTVHQSQRTQRSSEVYALLAAQHQADKHVKGCTTHTGLACTT